MRKITIILGLLAQVIFVSAQTTIISWNLRDFGQTKSDSAIAVIAKEVKHADIVAIQEVVGIDIGGAKAVARLHDELNRTGSKWDYAMSDRTNSSSNYVSERYAYFWKTSKVKLIGRAFLDEGLDEEIEREPYVARFAIDQDTVLVFNFHARSSKAHPEQEIKHFKYLPLRYANDNIIILGDFNVVSHHTVFNPLIKLGFKLVLGNEKTTLKRKYGPNGEYLSKGNDNIFYDAKAIKKLDGGVNDYVTDLYKNCRISDHLPVWMTFEFED